MAESNQTDNTKLRWYDFPLTESRPLIVPTGMLVLAILCGILVLTSPEIDWLSPTAASPIAATGASEALTLNSLNAPRLLAIPVQMSTPASFIVVKEGTSDIDDLFLYMTTTVTTSNLTNTPVITELWPVLSPDGQRLAYYALGDTMTNLSILSLPNGSGRPITDSAGESGLHKAYKIAPVAAPVFSPGGNWVAFLAKAIGEDTLEPFVARTDGQQVIRINDLGLNVVGYTWLDDTNLLVSTRSADEDSNLWLATLGSESVIKLKELKQAP